MSFNKNPQSLIKLASMALLLFFCIAFNSCFLDGEDPLEHLFSSGDTLLVVSRTNNEIYASDDFMNWNHVSNTAQFIYKACYGDGKFILVGGGANGNTFSSMDGFNWIDHGNMIGTNVFNSITYGKGLFVIGGTSGKLYSSPDGVQCVERFYAGVLMNIYGVCYGDDKFVAVGPDRTFISGDGVNWQDKIIPNSELYDVQYARGKYIAVGYQSAPGISLIYSSTDAINWTGNLLSGPVGLRIRAVTYGNSLYVAVGENGRIYVSEDGTNWSNFNSIVTSSTLYDVVYAYPYFVAVGTGSVIIISEDGYQWRQVLNLGASDFFSIAVRH